MFTERSDKKHDPRLTKRGLKEYADSWLKVARREDRKDSFFWNGYAVAIENLIVEFDLGE